MGILRYFLAIVVAMGHTPVQISKPLDADGGLAVQAFFVISGFYMSLITEKYRLSTFNFNAIRKFYESRLLRIFPVYYICILLTLILCSVDISPPPPFHLPSDVLASLNSVPDKLAYCFENIFLFGQAFMRFFIYSNHSFVFQPYNDAVDANLLAAGFAILGQAWTLSIELSFYLLVPFLLTQRVGVILLICVASFACRLILSKTGYSNYNIQHGFLPTALGVFLLGSLSHKLFYRNNSKYYTRKLAVSLLVIILGYGIFFYQRNQHYDLQYWFFIAMVVVALPVLFGYFKNSKLDRFIGELSYPLYMTHFFCIGVVLKYCSHAYAPYYVVILSTVISITLLLLVIHPLDKFRARLSTRTAEEASSTPSLQFQA